MAELTQQKVERAVMAMDGCTASVIDNLELERMARAATPFLQLPLEKVSEQEWHAALVFEVKWKGGASDGVRAMLDAFVINRNVALLPKPVDPRRAVLLKQLSTFNVRDEQELEEEVTEILAAMDEVK